MKKLSALLSLLVAAFVYSNGVVYFYRVLEDSPYLFNLGRSYPAGINPDFGNRLSLSWDLIVLASCCTFFAVVLGFLVFLVSLIRSQNQNPLLEASSRVQPFAWTAFSSLALILGAMVS